MRKESKTIWILVVGPVEDPSNLYVKPVKSIRDVIMTMGKQMSRIKAQLKKKKKATTVQGKSKSAKRHKPRGTN